MKARVQQDDAKRFAMQRAQLQAEQIVNVCRLGQFFAGKTFLHQPHAEPEGRGQLRAFRRDRRL